MKFCPECGQELSSDQTKFCGECGHSLQGNGAPIPEQEQVVRVTLGSPSAATKRKVAFAAAALFVLLAVGFAASKTYEAVQQASRQRALQGAMHEANLRYAQALSIANANPTFQMLASVTAKHDGQFSVGDAADSPNKVLITHWTPTSRNGRQWLIDPNTPPNDYLASLEFSKLSGPMDWNCAFVDGYVVLTGYESESLPADALTSLDQPPVQSAPAEDGASTAHEPVWTEPSSEQVQDDGNDWSAPLTGETLYLVIAASEQTKADAEAKYREFMSYQGDAAAHYYVDESDHFDGLSPGLWIVYAGFEGREAGDSEVEWAARGGYQPYVKQATKQCDCAILLTDWF